MSEEKISNVKAIKLFFESGIDGRPVNMAELKALTKEEREELGELCRKELEAK